MRLGSFFPVVLFVMLYKVVTAFKPIDKIERSESYWHYFPVVELAYRYLADKDI